MTKPQLERIKEFFEQGGTVEDLITPAERELLKRISILRYFNEEIFDRFLRGNLTAKGAPKFAEFVRNPHLEAVPRTVDTYAIKEASRNQFLDQLASDANSNSETWRNERRVFEKLTAYYGNKGPEFDLDRLVLLTLVNPGKVKDELESLYKEADERCDLARCNDLLRTLEIRFRLLPDEVRRFCLSRRQYYNARSLYISDYYQTNTYLERGNMTQAFANLTAGESGSKRWVFHVYATGGLGKTMFVRSLISRYCLPDPNRIPVARLDFDLLDLTYASRYPLLLLLPIAEQLNQQIEQRPFTEVFSHMWRFKPLLETPMGGAPNLNRPELEASFKSIEASWRQIALKEFCRTLEEVSFDRAIVIAIDTFEQMLFLNKDALVKIIEQVQEMHRAFPPLRLILSGRYDLRQELKDALRPFFEKETLHRELKRFDQKETRTYLTQKRGLKDLTFINAIVEKCAAAGEGEVNPFIVSLMSDLVSAKEVNTVEDIEKFPRAEVAYMIQRVIDRIQDFDVRWLLRYAVIPRVLTLEVIENILWPHLKQERQEKRGEDLQCNFGKFDQTEYWRYGEAATAKEAWDKLSTFASSYGWIQYENNDKTRLRLHSEVIVPMRFLLAEETIFELLHRDASSYFATKADAKPDEFGTWMSEAIYHRFQYEGQNASKFWRRHLSSERLQHDPETRRLLAAEITKRRDYVDEKGAPLKSPRFGAGIVSEKGLCLAHYEAAFASIMLATKHKPETDQYADEWAQAREHLLQLRALLQSGTEPDFNIRFDTELYAKLASHLNKPLIDYDRVIPQMEEALSSTGGLFLPLSLQLQLAEMYARQEGSTIAVAQHEGPVRTNSEKAENYFRQARNASSIAGIPFLSRPTIHLKLADWYRNNKRFDKALPELEAALALPELEKEPALERQIKYLKAEVNREIGLYTSAARLAQELFEGTPGNATDRFDHALLFANIVSRELCRPLHVFNRLIELSQLARDQIKRTAVLNELHGRLLSDLMEFKEALNVLDNAKELWGRVPDAMSADRARLYRFECQLDQIGNVEDAAFLIEKWETDNDKEEHKDPELSAQMGLLLVRALYLQGEDDRARERWRSMLARNYITSSPRALVRVLCMGLALGFGGLETLEDLLGVLAEIQPASARLPLLGAFRFAERTTHTEVMQRELGWLIDLIAWPPEKRVAVVSVVMFADVLRFCNAMDRVESLLAREIGKALDREDLFAYFQLLSTLNRSGLYALPSANIHTSNFLQEHKSFTNLCFAALLEQAERELENGNLAHSEATLRNAIDNYGHSDTLNKWKAFSEELTGRLALKRGEHRKAAAHFAEASSIYQRLGNQRSARQIRRTANGRSKRKILERGTEEATIHSIRLESFGDGISVISSGGPRQKLESRELPKSDITTQLTASLKDRTEIFNLMATMTDDFTGFNQELGRVLFTAEDIAYLRQLRDRERFLDARLELPAAAAKLPWEWAAVEEDTVLSLFRYFYRCSSANAGESEAIKWIHFAAGVESGKPLKIDGFLGSPIRELLKRMGIQDRLNLPKIYETVAQRLREHERNARVRVLIVKPSFTTQIWTMRGSFESNLSSQYLYDELGFNSRSIEVVKPHRLPADLMSAVENYEPQLIHLESSFRQSPNTADVYLDFNVESASGNLNDTFHSVSDYLQLSPTMLNDALDSLPDSMLRPLVILEGQRTPSLSSTIHQVLLRNTFASELFRLGNTSGVVATGLFRHPEDRLRLLRPLIDQLGNMGSLGMAVNEINSRNIQTKADLDLISCPVLLTDNPLFILVPTQ